MDIDKLKQVMPLTKNILVSYSEDRWVKVQDEMNVKLPMDYKIFIDSYGTGSIDEFIWILTPFDDDEYIGLIKRGKEIRAAYQKSKNSNPDYFEHEVFPKEGGILPWAYTENGDEIYWLTEGGSENWHVIVYESRSSDYYKYNMGVLEFIYEIVSGKLVCPVFPDDFPGKSCKFVSC